MLAQSNSYVGDAIRIRSIGLLFPDNTVAHEVNDYTGVLVLVLGNGCSLCMVATRHLSIPYPISTLSPFRYISLSLLRVSLAMIAMLGHLIRGLCMPRGAMKAC